MRLQSSLSLILGSILISSLCYADEAEKCTQDFDSHKVTMMNALKAHLKIVQSDMALDDIKELMRNRLEVVREDARREFPQLDLEQKFDEAFSNIEAIESKEQLLLSVSSLTDDLNSSKVIVGGLVYRSVRIINNEGGLAWCALPLCIVPLAVDAAFLWVEAPLQAYSWLR